MISRVENVLATRNPSVTDENSWEEFTLTDVKAFVPGKRRFANILCASEETPVCVVGKLGVLEKQQKKLGRLSIDDIQERQFDAALRRRS